MKRLAITPGLLAVLILAFSGDVFALSADEIMEKANLAYYYGGDDGKAEVKMTITDKAKRERIRELAMLRMDLKDGGTQKYYLYFRNPPDVSGMVLMVWRNPDSVDDRWLYVPAIDLVRRVAASDKRSSFAGSHFTYEDVSGRSPKADDHQLVGEDSYDNKDVYVIESRPKEPSSVEFSRFVTLISKDDSLPLKAEYYDKAGKLYKTVTVEEVRVIDSIPTVVMAAATMSDGGKTVVEFDDIEYDIGLREEIFTERYLRNPPRRWVR